MFKRAFPLVLVSLFLVGCQSKPTDTRVSTLTPAQKKEHAQQRALYSAQISKVLSRAGDLANVHERHGSFNLVITLNEQNHVIDCQTQINRNFDPKVYPYNAELAKDLLSICWTSVLPTLPPSLINPNSHTAKVVAPLGVYPLIGLTTEQRLTRDAMVLDKAQDHFLYQQLLAPLPINSIGIATLMVMTDSSGHVQECAASLDPHALRRTEFKQDDALLSALVARCKHTNMSAMPGFKANPTGMTSLFHRIEYTPWKAGLKSNATNVNQPL